MYCVEYGVLPICEKYLKCRIQGAQKDAQLVVFSKKFKKSAERLMLQQRSKEIGLETILSFRSLPSVYHWTDFHSSFCMSKCSVHCVSKCAHGIPILRLCPRWSTQPDFFNKHHNFRRILRIFGRSRVDFWNLLQTFSCICFVLNYRFCESLNCIGSIALSPVLGPYTDWNF